ncbi:MAG: DUF927 domain-containing protein, partial [Ignavibacteriae bacterium]|nr:DUF927 domain-containing protein [Ignavibacteriota bacterium]
MIIHSSDDPGNSIGSTNSNLNNTSSNRTTKFEDDILLEPYILRKEISEFGYFYNNGREEIQLTNFIVKLEKQVIAEVNNKPEIYFSGKVEFTEGETVEIRKLRGKDLASPLQLITYLTNLCGTKISFPGSPNKLVEAIKTFNRDTELLRAEEFGYNEDLTEYITSDLVITKDSFIEKETAIKYNDLGKRNKLGFSLGSDDEFLEIKNGIIEDFLPWDSTQRTISALSFTFLPIIFPHLENVNEKKTYLMLKGPSGCGKSLMCEVLQQFYGDFKSLIPWNSTSTSINVAGHSFKDSAFMVDDFKSQSFNGPNKVNEVMTLLQNYADQTSKQRSNISLTIRDEKYIKGFLTISAEDL